MDHVQIEYLGRLTKLLTSGAIPKKRYTFLSDKTELTQSEKQEILDLELLSDNPPPVCPDCDIPFTVKYGKTGYFWGCPNYFQPQNCKRTVSIDLLKLRKRARLDADHDWPEETPLAVAERRVFAGRNRWRRHLCGNDDVIE